MSNRFKLPNLGVGLGLRTVHYPDILSQRPPVGWFEIVSENYMQTEGRPLFILDQIAELYPIVMHGVSMSIGSTDPLDMDYLRELKALKERVGALWVSDHLCWTGVQGKNTHDLLPMPYTAEALRHTAARIRQVSEIIEAPLMLENPSTYVEFASSEMTEWDFLRHLCEESNAGLLLDVNNVYVSAYNQGFAITEYLDGLPMDRVVQIHVAGHTNHGTHIVDTHIGPVIDPVWEIFAEVHRRTGGTSTMLEWDAEIPSFEETFAEARRALEFAADLELSGDAQAAALRADREVRS